MRAAASLVIVLTTRVALADDGMVGRPLVLAPGELVAELVVEADLGTFAQPLSLAPDAWLGVTRRLTVGLVASDAALDLVDDGASVCVRANPFFGCENHGTGVDLRYAVTDRIVPRVRVLERDLEPDKPALALGALVRVASSERFDLVVDPYVQLGLANNGLGNATAIVVPVFATVQLARPLALTAETGYVTDVAVWQDGFHIPLGVAVTARPARHLELAGQVGFTSLAGPQNDVKQREAFFVARYLSGR